MGDEVKTALSLGQQGKLLLQFPAEWCSSRNQTSLVLNSTAVIPNETRTGGISLRTCLADKFPDPDAIVDTVLRSGGGVQPFIEKSVTIAPGETAPLFHFQEMVSFGDNPDGPAELLRYSARSCYLNYSIYF